MEFRKTFGKSFRVNAAGLAYAADYLSAGIAPFAGMTNTGMQVQLTP